MYTYICTMHSSEAVIEVNADSVADAVQRVEKITGDYVVVCEAV